MSEDEFNEEELLDPEDSDPIEQNELKLRLAAISKRETRSLAPVDITEIPQAIREQIDILTNQKNYLAENPISRIQLRRLMSSSVALTSGLHQSSAMICNDKCLLQDRCPLAIIDQAPYMLGDMNITCPVEQRMLDEYFNRYVENYANRQGVSSQSIHDDLFTRDLLSELAETHILENRVNTKMASDGMLAEEVGGMNNDGQVATNLVESPLFAIKKYFKRRRSEIMKMLLLTPEMELKKRQPVAGDSFKEKEIRAKVKAYIDIEDEQKEVEPKE